MVWFRAVRCVRNTLGVTSWPVSRILWGGELKGYTELLQDSRKQATERMVAQAREVGANAIINVRFSTSSITQGASEIYVYGTAVKIQET